MQVTLALAALASVASAAIESTPAASAPAGCSTNYTGQFEVTIINSTTQMKRDLEKRQSTTCGQPGYLTVSLNKGILIDSAGRQGEIVANYQFQFDKALQQDAIYTGGFSVCNNGSLALGRSNVFYECLSGVFYNLYSQSIGGQCKPILINIIPCSGGSSSGVVGQSADGQPTGTSVGSKPVSQTSDGQIQATGSAAPKTTAVPVSRIGDGQVQATGAASRAPVSQNSDGQIQATSAVSHAPVSQISDGQIQATSAASRAPVSQISDGQIQATSAAGASTTSRAPVSQISDGQIQATSASRANATSTPVAFTGAGSALTISSTFAAFVIGLAAVALL